MGAGMETETKESVVEWYYRQQNRKRDRNLLRYGPSKRPNGRTFSPTGLRRFESLMIEAQRKMMEEEALRHPEGA